MGGSSRSAPEYKPPSVLKAVVGLAGYTGSGKSTLAQELELLHAFGRASFGDVVRAEARARGIGASTAELRAVGTELISQWGWSVFCCEVLTRLRECKFGVVEGIRHMGAVAGITQVIQPVPLLLVFVETDAGERHRRLALRDHASADEAPPFEEEIPQLRSRADLIVSGSDPGAVVAILNHVKSIAGP